METKMHKKKMKHNQKSSKSSKKLANGNELENGCGILDDEELHSLTHYAGDEEKLVDHMFAAIQGTKLAAMMPGVLKAIPLQDLKLLCVHELRGISKKRIIAIIQGKAMSDSSGSEDEEEEQRKEERPTHGKKRDRRSRRKEGDGRDGLKPGTDGDGAEKSLDIVELEMRARLIQTMLKKDPKHKGAVDASELMKATVKSEPVSDRSRSGSYSSRSRSKSYSRSRSRSRSSSGSSYSSGSDGSKRRKRSSHRQSRRDSRRRRQHRRRGGHSKKRGSSREGSVTPDRHHSDNEEKSKKQTTKKTKISRKEFEDRMRKAKETRTYRKRQDSEEEEEKVPEENEFEDQEQSVALQPQYMEYEGVRVEKEEGEAESEKEEGEIDSNEEDDKGSTYSGDGGGGGSSKRRPRRHHRRSGSRSSYTSGASGASDDNKSPSKKRHKKSKDSRHAKRRDVRMPVDKSLIIATLNEASGVGKPLPITGGKTKPGIEAVDSEEDFDSPSSANLRSEKFEEISNMVPRTDRTNVSFSFNKKPQTNILQGRDLEFGMTYSRPNSYKSQQLKGSDQIVISSDSDHEGGSKHKRPRVQGSDGAPQSPMVIDEDTNTASPDKEATHNVSDQSDLKLCEETVMKDIFADIDDEDDARLEIKRELLIKSEPAEVEDSSVISSSDIRLSSEIDISSKPMRSRSHSKSSRKSSMECNTSDILVKQEMLSPHEAATCDSPPPAAKDLVKSELCYEDPQSQSFSSAYDDTPKVKPKRRKKAKQAKAVRTNRENSRQRSGNNSPDMSDYNAQENVTEMQRRKTNEMSNDSEEGACTDQDTDLNGSFVNHSNDDIETPHITNVMDTSGSVNEDVAQHPMEEAPARTSVVSESQEIRVTEDNDREEIHKADLTGSQHNNDEEEDEEDIGLVDLPEDEHFEVDDDEDTQGATNKYNISDLKEMQEEVEDSEVTADVSDFYRGAEGLSFNKEGSRFWADSSVEPEKTREEGEVDDDEDSKLDAELVELQPEEAEELVTEEIESTVPVVMQGNTEIIGEIEPSSDGTELLGNLAEAGSSWSSRWLQSEKVQKVVSNCKMLSRMRKRIKIDKLNAKTSVAAAAVSAAAVATSSTAGSSEAATSDIRNAEPETVPVIGSMEEYQRMLAEKEPSREATAGTPDAEGDAAQPQVAATEDSDDSGEDELWSKMMGN